MEKTATGLPLDFHDDATPIFERGDFIREPQPLPPENRDLAVIYKELMLPEDKGKVPNLRYNLSILRNDTNESNDTNQENRQLATRAWLGKSYPHPKRGVTFGRIIQGLDPNCRIIIQRQPTRGKITDIVILSLQPLQYAVIPPDYETILVNNSSDQPARFFELQAREENRDIEHLEALNGAGYLVKSENGDLKPNDNYTELPIPKIRGGLNTFKFLPRRPLYSVLKHHPDRFNFIDPPRREFFSGAL